MISRGQIRTYVRTYVQRATRNSPPLSPHTLLRYAAAYNALAYVRDPTTHTRRDLDLLNEKS